MIPVGSINSLLQSSPVNPAELAPKTAPLPDQLTAAPAEGFGRMLDGLVSAVDAKQAQADALTNKVLLGDGGQLHQSVIAMQEASTALSLMVSVRNKLVESYQELMRMQV
jgi:flagellar hook-basal body complex protein FliE